MLVFLLILFSLIILGNCQLYGTIDDEYKNGYILEYDQGSYFSATIICSQQLGGAVDNTESDTVTKLDGTNYYYFPIDFDGAYNYGTTQAITGGGNVMTDSYTSASGPDNDPSEATHDNQANINECIALCQATDNCIQVAWDTDNSRCTLSFQCMAVNVISNYDSRTSLNRLNFTNFNADATWPHSDCFDTGYVQESGPTHLGLTRPVTPDECFTHCSAFSNVDHLTLDGDGACNCFSTCELQSATSASGNEAGDMIAATTVFQYVLPTPAPTTTPAPTAAPTTSQFGEYFVINDEFQDSKIGTYLCVFQSGSVIDNSNSGTQETLDGTNYYYYPLDWDGYYNYDVTLPVDNVNSGGNPGPVFDDWGATGVLAADYSNLNADQDFEVEGQYTRTVTHMSNESLGGGGGDVRRFLESPMTLDLCQKYCISNDECHSFGYEVTTDRCALGIQCKAISSTTSTYSDRISYLRTNFSTFGAIDVIPFSICGAGSVSLLAPFRNDNEPMTADECYNSCIDDVTPGFVVTHIQLNGNMECSCFASCNPSEADSVDITNADLDAATTIYQVEYPLNITGDIAISDVRYQQISQGQETLNTYSYGCTNANFASNLKSEKLSSQVQITSESGYIAYPLDGDISFNVLPTPAQSISKPNNYRQDNEVSAALPDNALRKRTQGPFLSLTQCFDACSLDDTCTTVVFAEGGTSGNYNCGMLTHCKAFDVINSPSYSNMVSYVKQTFTSFIATAVHPFTRCSSGTQVGASTTSGDYYSPEDCYNYCDGLGSGFQYISVDRNFVCSCWSTCTLTETNNTDNENSQIASNTVWEVSTPSPTKSPTEQPTTLSPSKAPTTPDPTTSPSNAPTTLIPTTSPSKAPTTPDPTTSPSKAPTTLIPTTSPSKAPTTPDPTTSPSKAPTTPDPTTSPSTSPSKAPTELGDTPGPTTSPTTPAPSSSPSVSPSKSPTTPDPTKSPSTSPSKNPTTSPSTSPSKAPTDPGATPGPTVSPTISPTTLSPTGSPTTPSPTESPTTLAPTVSPTSSPSDSPTTLAPTSSPTSKPTSKPTPKPTPRTVAGLVTGPEVSSGDWLLFSCILIGACLIMLWFCYKGCVNIMRYNRTYHHYHRA